MAERTRCDVKEDICFTESATRADEDERELPILDEPIYHPRRYVEIGGSLAFRPERVGHISPRKVRMAFIVRHPGRFVFPFTSCDAQPFVRPIAAPISSSVNPRRAHSEVNRSISCLS